MKRIHLLSNAHLDPVWQWEWEEGAAAAVSTFRAAAQFCEEYDGYIFNHNEVILYQWIEEYEPVLFQTIQRLVMEGKWNIMGGWYLQPDCNMPSGESLVRQILLGKVYFKQKFGVEPTTAINFDSFGHSEGLVQIMAQAGYDSYIFMRPDGFDKAPAREFSWKGFNGSSIAAHRLNGSYQTLLGEAHIKIKQTIEEASDAELCLVLWGVGNHGGGPSRLDLNQIRGMMDGADRYELLHSTPEQYFQELKARGELPGYSGDLNPRFVGCYTSMIRIKLKHRQLESQLFMTEKMLSAAAAQQLLDYPVQEVREVTKDLMMAQFHDILPGTAIPTAEEASLRLLDHGLEIAARLRARAFFALAAGQQKAALNEYPILIYNPHPYVVKGIFECEFMLEDQNWKEQFSMPVLFQNGVKIASQAEKEESNVNLDWRKRIVFEAELQPSCMNRFDCRLELLPAKPIARLPLTGNHYIFAGRDIEVKVNTLTGLLDSYKVNGVDYVLTDTFLPIVLQDNEDPWRMDTNVLRDEIGSFTLMSAGKGTDFSGVSTALLPSVRVIEDGSVRTVIEAMLEYGNSSIVLTYKLPKKGAEIEVQVRVFWQEKDKMLKLSIPSVIKDGKYIGQTAFGAHELAHDGAEAVSHKWVALSSEDDNLMLTCINNGTYGSDCVEGQIRLSLIRSTSYCAHPILERSLVPQNRFSPRIDQGERLFTFWLQGGSVKDRRSAIDREADNHHERPYSLSFFPSGLGEPLQSFCILEGGTVQMSAMKKEECGASYIIRLFEPTGESQTTTLKLPLLGISRVIHLEGFEIQTYRLDMASKTISICPLCESTSK